MGELAGRGETMSVFYQGETVETLLEQLSAVMEAVSNGISRIAAVRRAHPDVQLIVDAKDGT
jgi:hypothetical protein